MKVELVPLLTVQRDLYRMPRGWERFQQYLRVMLTDDRDDVQLPPMVLMNPMGKDHVPALLDALLAFDAEAVATQAVSDASARLGDRPGQFRLGLVVVDDAMGGWTNRHTTELGHRLGITSLLKRGWLSGILWTSEEPTVLKVREEVLTTVFRAVYLQEFGPASTLREILAQEGFAMAQAGCMHPALEPDDLDYTREIIKPQLDSTDQPTHIGCLFGDAAARALGYRPQGLSERAGLALALQEARSSPPVSVLPSARNASR